MDLPICLKYHIIGKIIFLNIARNTTDLSLILTLNITKSSIFNICGGKILQLCKT